VDELRERRDARRQRAHQLVRGEVEVLQGPQGAERGGEDAAEGEIVKIDPSDGSRGVVGARDVRPAARGAAVGGGGPAGESAGGVAKREPGGDEMLGVGGCASNGLEQEQQEREEAAGGIHGWRLAVAVVGEWRDWRAEVLRRELCFGLLVTPSQNSKARSP